jgi:hypothetical protein
MLLREVQPIVANDELRIHHSPDNRITVYRNQEKQPILQLDPTQFVNIAKDQSLVFIRRHMTTAPRSQEVLNTIEAVARDLLITPKWKPKDVDIFVQEVDNKLRGIPAGRITGRRDNDKPKNMEAQPAKQLEWSNNSDGLVIRWKEGKEQASAYLFEDSCALASTLTEYNTKKDDFVWSFDPAGKELSWKERSQMAKVLSSLDDDTRFFLEGGKDIETIIETLEIYLENDQPSVLSFEINLEESNASLLPRAIEALDVGYRPLIASQKWGSNSRLFLVKESLHKALFTQHLREIEQIDPTLAPQEKETLVMTYGAFSPITNDHIVMIKKMIASAKQVQGSNLVFIKPSKEFAHDEVSLKQKAQVIKEAVPEANICMETGLYDIFDALVYAYNLHYKNIYIITASDEVAQLDHMVHENNGKQTNAGFFDFQKHHVISYGKDNPDNSQAAQMGRNALANNDFASFAKAVQGPELPYLSSMKKLFNILKYELRGQIGMNGV